MSFCLGVGCVDASFEVGGVGVETRDAKADRGSFFDDGPLRKLLVRVLLMLPMSMSSSSRPLW